MRSGVQEFLGNRLNEARRARGITSRKALSDILGRSASTVGRWEDGESLPEPAALADLARALALPAEFFLASRSSAPSVGFFRSLSSALEADRDRQSVRLRWLMDITEVADHYAHLPEVRFPKYFHSTFAVLREDEIERIANDLRDLWEIGLRPIQNMVQLLESNGVVVGSETMETTRLDGISAWNETSNRPFILLADDKQSFARRQFDCAHELGHLVLHRGVTREQLLADFELIEDQANRFASSFLLPASQLPLDVVDVSMWGLERLKTRWKVSIKALIMRLRELEIIDVERASRMFKSYSAKGYAKGEPYDDVWPLQMPTLLADVFRALVDNGLSKADLIADLVLGTHDVESLAALPEGWFTLPTARVVSLRDGFARPQGRRNDRLGDLLSFTKPTRD